MVEVAIPWVNARPPFVRSRGLEPADRAWKEELIRRCARGELEATGVEDPGRLRRAIDSVALRCYHVARVVQAFFGNPNHGNYLDPFLESLFIMLSWRTRIEDAKELVEHLTHQFGNPTQLFEEKSREDVVRIVRKAGFSGKRPDMIKRLVERFAKRFPDGAVSDLRSWDDDAVLEFLTSIPGIGRKSALCVLMYSLGRDRFPIDAHIRRVLKRTGLLKDLYRPDDDEEHRKFQLEAEQFVPPSTRRALHTGLVSIGKEYCHASSPRCDDCPIRWSCDYYRTKCVVLAAGRSLTHIDLFCGAGGFATGFEREGYRTLLAVDCSEPACDTFRLNHPGVPDENVIMTDLKERSVEEVISKARQWRDEIRRDRVDVITAGIPCQGFSKAGYRSRPRMNYDPSEDPRNQLYRTVVEWTKGLQPLYSVIENVPDIRSAAAEEGRILDAVCRAFMEIGYQAEYGTVNALDFGVPQVRRRFILIASHPSVPVVRPSDFHQYGSRGGTLVSAIGNLPPLKAGDGEWYTSVRGQVVTGHVARYHNQDDLEILEAIRPGESYTSFTERRRDVIKRRQHREKHAVYSTRSFSDKFYKMEPDKPSRTIVAHLQRDGNGYIHPEQVRSITPREAMRIQGFDDDRVVCGSRGRQFIQIGNAIPPPLARVIARTLKQKIKLKISGN